MSGIRVGIEVSGEACPIVRESVRNGTDVEEVNRTALDGDDAVVEEVVFEDEVDASSDSFSELFSTGDRSVYQYSRSSEANCACEHVEESLRHPISEVRIRNDSLYFTIHLNDVGDLKSLIGTLEDQFDTVSVCKIDHSEIKANENTMAFDREALTSRQREVYRTAYEMGYFEHDGDANATDIADELDIAVSTLSEHLNAVQQKLADAYFDAGTYS